MAHHFTGAVGTVLAVSLFAASGVAQSPDPQCSAAKQPTVTQDACQKVVDLFHYVSPRRSEPSSQAGTQTLGQIGAIGNTGHFSFELRGVGDADRSTHR